MESLLENTLLVSPRPPPPPPNLKGKKRGREKKKELRQRGVQDHGSIVKVKEGFFPNNVLFILARLSFVFQYLYLGSFMQCF